MNNTTTDGMTPEKLETFVNDYLRRDLTTYELHLDQLNAEIMEFIQLKNMVESISTDFKEGFKTQVNIGGNCFIQVSNKHIHCVRIRRQRISNILISIHTIGSSGQPRTHPDRRGTQALRRVYAARGIEVLPI